MQEHGTMQLTHTSRPNSTGRRPDQAVGLSHRHERVCKRLLVTLAQVAREHLIPTCRGQHSSVDTTVYCL